MSNRTNPHENARVKSHSSLQYAFLRTGTVTSAPDGQSNGQHHVAVQEAGITSDGPLPVLPSVHGDFYIPPEGAPVTIAPTIENEYMVVGAPVPPVDTPTLDPGERVISHPLSGAHVRFNKDGSIDIKGDATVRINDGNEGVITDVQAGGTNSNGGITSLNITRDSNILI
jgi:hypothetical protein